MCIRDSARAGHYAIVAVCRTLAAATREYIFGRGPGNDFVCVDLLLVRRTAVHEKTRDCNRKCDRSEGWAAKRWPARNHTYYATGTGISLGRDTTRFSGVELQLQPTTDYFPFSPGFSLGVGATLNNGNHFNGLLSYLVIHTLSANR